MYFVKEKKHHKINTFKLAPPKIHVEIDILPPPQKKKKTPAQIGIPMKIVDKNLDTKK